MIPTLRAEFRKLLTVRTTYVISLLFLLLSVFFSFYVHGFRDSGAANMTGQSPIDQASASLFVAGSITQIASIISVAGGLIALLLLAHEYRYSTIIYTLTASNRRSKVLAAKIVAVLGYVLVYTLIAVAISLLSIWLGSAAAGHSLPHQDINLWDFFGKCLFYSEAYAMAGLLFVTLIRNQIGAIAALLILPNTIEGLLTLLLKNNAIYLPFTALSHVIQTPVIIDAAPAHPHLHDLSMSPAKGGVVFMCYLLAGWIIAWWLFVRRDAN